jgi:hypothetical protein
MVVPEFMAGLSRAVAGSPDAHRLLAVSRALQSAAVALVAAFTAAAVVFAAAVFMAAAIGKN